MSQSQEKLTKGRTEGRTDRETLYHRTLPYEARGPITNSMKKNTVCINKINLKAISRKTQTKYFLIRYFQSMLTYSPGQVGDFLILILLFRKLQACAGMFDIYKFKKKNMHVNIKFAKAYPWKERQH